MADLKWKPSGRATNPVTIVSTELDALANNAGALSASISNETDLDLYVDSELSVTFATTPTANSLIEAYVVRQIDGTNYEDGAGGATPITPKNGFVGGFVLRAVTTAQRMILPQVSVPVRDSKILLVNKSGQTFPTSGSTLKGYFYKEQAV